MIIIRTLRMRTIIKIATTVNIIAMSSQNVCPGPCLLVIMKDAQTL